MMRIKKLLIGGVALGLIAFPLHVTASAKTTFVSLLASQAGDADAMSPEEVVEQIRRFRPKMTDYLTGREDSTDKARKQLAEFRAQMDAILTPQFIARANDSDQRGYRRAVRRAEVWADQTKNRILGADLAFAEDRAISGAMRGQFAAMVFEGEGLRQLSRLYPDNAKIAEAVAATRERVAGLGSFTAIEQRIATAEAEKAARIRLRPARRTNAVVASDFSRAFKASNYTATEFPGAQILKLNLIETGWTVERNPVTGIILSRYQRAHLGIKAADGKCYAYMVLFEQKANGSGYSQTYMRSGQHTQMLCENI